MQWSCPCPLCWVRCHSIVHHGFLDLFCLCLAPLPRHNGQAFLGLRDLTILQNAQAHCTNHENHCVMQFSAYRQFCPTKILVTVVPWELLAQNYIIFRNPKVLQILLFSKHKLKKRKIENLFYKKEKYSIFQNGILKMN